MMGDMDVPEICVFTPDEAEMTFQWMTPDACVEVYAIDKERLKVVRITDLQQAVEFFNK